MLYSKVVTVPAQTVMAVPQIETLKVTNGIIRHIWVRWRYGSGNLCGVRLRCEGFVHWPLTLGEWFPSTPYPLEFDESFPVETEPYQVLVEAYNLDDVYTHDVWIAVLVSRYHGVPGFEALLDYLVT